MHGSVIRRPGRDYVTRCLGPQRFGNTKHSFSDTLRLSCHTGPERARPPARAGHRPTAYPTTPDPRMQGRRCDAGGRRTVVANAGKMPITSVAYGSIVGPHDEHQGGASWLGRSPVQGYRDLPSLRVSGFCWPLKRRPGNRRVACRAFDVYPSGVRSIRALLHRCATVVGASGCWCRPPPQLDDIHAARKL